MRAKSLYSIVISWVVIVHDLDMYRYVCVCYINIQAITNQQIQLFSTHGCWLITYWWNPPFDIRTQSVGCMVYFGVWTNKHHAANKAVIWAPQCLSVIGIHVRRNTWSRCVYSCSDQLKIDRWTCQRMTVSDYTSTILPWLLLGTCISFVNIHRIHPSTIWLSVALSIRPNQPQN